MHGSLQMNQKHKKRIATLAWGLWLLGSMLFFAEYIVRTSASIMLPELMATFAVNATGIGLISVFFYYPYTLMQLPVGLLVDRLPAGKLLAGMALLFAFGVLLFATAEHLLQVYLARIFMGLSAAFAFVGTLKLVTQNFPARMLGFLTGATQAIGMLGAAMGEGPSAYLVSEFGWRSYMFGMSALIFAIAVGLWLCSRGLKSTKKTMSLPLWQDVQAAILSKRQVLLNASFAALLYAPTMVFGELWGVEYLESVHQISHATAAYLLSWVFIGWGVGAPILGLISDMIGLRKPIFYFAVFGCLLVLLCMICLSLSEHLLGFLLFFYGFANSGLVIAYALSGELNPHKSTGLTLAFTNMASVLLGAFCQPIFGKILALNWSGLLVSGVPKYSQAAYEQAFLLLPCLLLLAVCVSFFIQETNCKRVAL